MALRLLKGDKRKALIASLALLAIGAGGVAVSGAYFTNQQTLTANTLSAGTVQLGNVGDNGTTALAFNNILPVADANVATQAQTFNINVRNTGTAAIDWAATPILTSNASAAATALAGAVNISYSTDGTTWSTAQTLSALAASPTTITGTNLASGSTTKIQVRAWLPATTGNSVQGNSLSFDLRVRAIQTGAPGLSTDSNFS